MFTFLDVSKYQGDTPEKDFVTVSNHQIEGQYIRGIMTRAIAKEQQVDPELTDNLTRARDTGRLWTGAYHNLVHASITEQFSRFRQSVPEWRGVVPMVDSEQGASFADLVNFMRLAKMAWGLTPSGKVRCLVYLPRWYWLGLSDRGPLPPEWVWVHSHYDTTPGPLIPPLKSLEGHVWQHTNKAVIPGITENVVDLNRVYMDEAEFLQLAV